MEPQQSGCAGGAEAVLNLQPDSSIPIVYHPHYGPSDDLILLEIDSKLLPDILHQKVILRGQLSEDAVLCTQSKTYAIKFVGNSNYVLLIPPVDQSTPDEHPQNSDEKDDDQKVVASVIKVASGNMELVEVAPGLDKLKLLLLENPYTPEVSEKEELQGTEEQTTNLYTWDDLIDRVQASDDELRSGLQALSAVEIDGYWRVVDDNYMDTMVNMLLHNSVLNDWSLDALGEDEVVGALESDGFPRTLGLHCLQVYGNKADESIGQCVWKLDERRVCIHFARKILKDGKRKMESFMEEWMRKIPDGMQARFDMLEGEVLTEKFGIETWVYVFSVSSLPYNPAERFSMLFQERPKWEWKDLQHYIRDLMVPGLSSEGLLLKYTRKTQPNFDAEPVFSAR